MVECQNTDIFDLGFQKESEKMKSKRKVGIETIIIHYCTVFVLCWAGRGCAGRGVAWRGWAVRGWAGLGWLCWAGLGIAVLYCAGLD